MSCAYSGHLDRAARRIVITRPLIVIPRRSATDDARLSHLYDPPNKARLVAREYQSSGPPVERPSWNRSAIVIVTARVKFAVIGLRGQCLVASRTHDRDI